MILIKKTAINDLPNVVSCHKDAFPHALSTKLGNHFCSTMLSWYIVNERGIMIHAEENGEIVGYTGGIIVKQPGLPGAATSITQFSFNQFIRSFLIRPWLIFHPENLHRFQFILRNVKLKLGISKKQIAVPINTAFISRWGLVVIGVRGRLQGKGVGSLLLNDFVDRAINDGVKEVTLSVKKKNKQAIAAYKKNGWLINQEDLDSLSMFKNI